MSSPPITPPEPGLAASHAVTEPEPIPAMQQVLDNPFLLLFIGVTVPTVFYIIWGIMEIVSIPMAR